MWVTLYAQALAAAVCMSAANLSRQLAQAESQASAAGHADHVARQGGNNAV